MEIYRKRSPRDIARGFFLLTHPGPVAFFLITVTLLAFRITWPHPLWMTIILLIAAHAALQFSISMINDYCDRHLDVGRADKPIVNGLVQPREALAIGLLMIGIMIILLLLLNPLVLGVSLLYLALGQSYNLGLKSTPWSGTIIALMIALLPLYVFAGVGHIHRFAYWFVLVGFLLGIALNVANSLPDLEGDWAAGAKTLAVTLGLERSFLVSPLILISTATLIAILTFFQFVPAQLWIVIPILMLTGIGIGSMLLFFGPHKLVATRKIYFYVVTLTCFILAAGWFISIKL